MPAPRTLILALAAASLAASAHADGYTRDATRVLNQARTAMGGKGWNLLHGWRETGVVDGVRYEAWIDPLRWGLREERPEGSGKRIHGFNGIADWQVAPDGTQMGVNDHASLSKVRTRAFIDGWLFFYPSRFDGRGAYLGVKTLGGRAYDVVRVQPAGGAPRELWFDARNHLLGRIVDRSGPRPAAIRVSDYRRVGPVTVAFKFEPEAGAPPGVERREIQNLTFASADRDLFSLPPPPPKPVVQAPPPAPPPPPPEPPKKKRKWWQRR